MMNKSPCLCKQFCIEYHIVLCLYLCTHISWLEEIHNNKSPKETITSVNKMKTEKLFAMGIFNLSSEMRSHIASWPHRYLSRLSMMGTLSWMWIFFNSLVEVFRKQCNLKSFDLRSSGCHWRSANASLNAEYWAWVWLDSFNLSFDIRCICFESETAIKIYENP